VKTAKYRHAVHTALARGYRHIDTAQTYRNEKAVGSAIRRSGIAPDEIFLTSKLHPVFNSYEGSLIGIKKSVKALKASLDLYLVHYPGVGNPIAALKGLAKARSEGLCPLSANMSETRTYC
jgi:diketogulonate reductase-like aldo/keto reductase